MRMRRCDAIMPSVRLIGLLLALLCAGPAARTACAQQSADWGVPRPPEWDRLVADIAAWCPTSNANAWDAIEAAYRETLAAHDRIRDDALPKSIVRFREDHEFRRGADERGRSAIERWRVVRAGLGEDDRFMGAVADALRTAQPDAAECDCEMLLRLAEMRRLASIGHLEYPAAPHAISAALAAEYSPSDTLIVREAARKAVDAILPSLRTLVDVSHDNERLVVRQTALWSERFPDPSHADAEEMRALRLAFAPERDPIDARVARTVPVLERGGFDPFIAGETGAIARMSPEGARRLAYALASSHFRFLEVPNNVKELARRETKVIRSEALSDELRALLRDRLVEARAQDASMIVERIRVHLKLTTRIAKWRHEEARGSHQLRDDEDNAAWDSINGKQLAPMREAMRAAHAFMSDHPETDWSDGKDVDSIAEFGWTASPTAEWGIQEPFGSVDQWLIEPLAEADIGRFADDLGLDEAAAARLLSIRGEPVEPTNVDGVASALWRELSEAEVDGLIAHALAELRSARAARAAHAQAITASEECKPHGPASAVWATRMAIVPAPRVVRRMPVTLESSVRWLDRVGDPASALAATELSPEERARAVEALAPLMATFQAADAALDDAELVAHLRERHASWQAARDMEADRSLEARLASDRAYSEAIGSIAAGVRAPAEARAAATQRAVAALRTVLSPVSFEQIRRSMRRLAFPRIDRERERFERPALAALALESLDEGRRDLLTQATARWDDEFEARTERIAACPPPDLHVGRSQSAEEYVQREITARWHEFARRQEGMIFLSRIGRILTDGESADVGRQLQRGVSD